MCGLGAGGRQTHMVVWCVSVVGRQKSECEVTSLIPAPLMRHIVHQAINKPPHPSLSVQHIHPPTHTTVHIHTHPPTTLPACSPHPKQPPQDKIDESEDKEAILGADILNPTTGLSLKDYLEGPEGAHNELLVRSMMGKEGMQDDSTNIPGQRGEPFGGCWSEGKGNSMRTRGGGGSPPKLARGRRACPPACPPACPQMLAVAAGALRPARHSPHTHEHGAPLHSLTPHSLPHSPWQDLKGINNVKLGWSD